MYYGQITKVNTTNLVAAIVTDDLEDPDDLNSTTGEIEEDTGSTQKPAEAPKEGLNNQEVGIDTEPSQHNYRKTPGKTARCRK